MTAVRPSSSRWFIVLLLGAILYGLVLISWVGLLDLGFTGWAASTMSVPATALVVLEVLFATMVLGVALTLAFRDQPPGKGA